MHRARVCRLAVAIGVTLGVGLARHGDADQIFADGFEECGAGRWVSPNFPAPPEAFDALAPTLLAETLGACAPSLVSAEFRLADGSVPGAEALSDIVNSQTAVLRAFGTGGIVPRAGGTMTALSTGRARDADAPGFTDPTLGNDFGNSGFAPPAYLAAHGGVLPTGGCAAGLTTANDSVALRLTFDVPATAVALRFDWLFASADYPDYVCNGGSAFVDFFLALAEGTAPGLPADGNVALVEGDPVSTVFVPFVHCTGCENGTAAIAGTGYDGHGMTAWHTAEVPVVGGESLVLDLMTFDPGDWVVNSLVLIDGLRWVTP